MTLYQKHNLDCVQDQSAGILYKIRLTPKITQVPDRAPEKMYAALKRPWHETPFAALGDECKQPRRD